ncbi:MAG: sulfotransferase [Phycisphaerales bacterium]|nr:sulfotransferase [Phycisphaerales bacterium]
MQRAAEMVSKGQLEEADRILRSDIPSPSRDADALRMRGAIAERRQRIREAVEFAEKSQKIQPHPDTLTLLAQIKARRGDHENARALCREALEMRPNHLPAVFMLAGGLLQSGDHDEVTELLAPLLAEPPELAEISRRLHTLHAENLLGQDRAGDAAEILDREVLVDGIGPIERRGALRLRTKAAMRQAQLAEAFEYAQTANALARSMFVPRRHDDMVDGMMKTWTREQMASFPSGDSDSEKPVFIAGMPRSGGDLVSRILAAHPDVGNGNESPAIGQFAGRIASEADNSKPAPECFGSLQTPQWQLAARQYLAEAEEIASPTATRLLSNFSGNDRLAGVISRLFPKARMIHVLRDPRDVAVSIHLGILNSETHPWSTRLDWIAAAWATSQRLMAHWKKELDIPILEVRYEQLVENPESEIRRILEFLGLPWDDACLRFHEDHPPIRPLDRRHVDQPLNTGSIGRHAEFTDQLSGVEWPDF